MNGRFPAEPYRDRVQLSGHLGVFDPTKCSDEQLRQLEAALVPIAASSGDAPDGEGGEG
jgi:hypothetical protein